MKEFAVELEKLMSLKPEDIVVHFMDSIEDGQFDFIDKIFLEPYQDDLVFKDIPVIRLDGVSEEPKPEPGQVIVASNYRTQKRNGRKPLFAGEDLFVANLPTGMIKVPKNKAAKLFAMLYAAATMMEDE